MKVTLNDGTEIECTAQEFIELKQQGLIGSPIQKPTPIQKPIQKHTPTQHFNPPKKHIEVSNTQEPKGFGGRWEEDEIKTLMAVYNNKQGQNVTKNEMLMLQTLLPHRSKMDICQKASDIKAYNNKHNINLDNTNLESPSLSVSMFGNSPKTGLYRLVPEDEKILKQNAHLRLHQIAKLLKIKNAKLNSILNKYYGGLKSIRKQLGVKSPYEMTEEHKHKVISANKDRFVFLNTQANAYMKRYNWGRDKAWAQAVDDWNNKKTTLTYSATGQIKAPAVKPLVEFPRFSMLSQSGNKIIEDMAKNIIGINGTLSYREIQYVQLKDEALWTVTKWKEFVEEFLRFSTQISDSFMAPNKFKMRIGDNGFITIKYGE